MNKLMMGLLVAVTTVAAPVASAEGRRSGVEYARVLSATPVYRSVRIDASPGECRNGRVIRPDGGAYVRDSHTGDAAHGQPLQVSARGERTPRCGMVRESRYEERLEGYDVAYQYKGRIYHARMPHDPGDRIAVQVDVRPVRY